MTLVGEGTPARSKRASGRGGAFAGTGTLARFMLRRDRIKLPAWAIGLGLFVIYLVTALPGIAETEEELAATTQLYTEPIGRLLTGPGYGFDAPTYERFVANGYGLYFLVIAALMSILLVIRHTRVEEQTGRAELVRANAVGRHSSLAAAMIVALVANFAVGLVVAVLMIGTVFMIGTGGFAVAGSFLFAAGITATGLSFAGVAVITAQLSESSRGAAGMAGGVLGVAFVLRAGGDLAEIGGNALSWISPLGWGQQSAPFVLDRWWPLTLSIGFALATTGIGFFLAGRRDLGASFVAVRQGPGRAAPSLGTPLGLAWRLQRAGILGWTLALGAAGLVFGAYADALLDAMDDMPDELVALLGADDFLSGYLGVMALFMALLAAAYAVTAVQGLRTEETSHRAEPILATAVSRTAWLGTSLVVTTAGVIIIMVVTGATTGIGAAIVTGDARHIPELVLAHLNQIPGVLVVLGVAAALFGAIPRTVPAAWTLIGYGMFVGFFGPMLDLPQILPNLSPFTHAAQMPIEAFEGMPLLALTLLAALTAAVGFVAFRRRDINVT